MGRCRRELAKILALILVATCLFQPGMAAHASVSDRDPASGSRQEQPAGEQPELASDSNASQKEEPEDIQEEPERDQDSDSDSRQDHPKGDRPEKATDSSASPEREPEDSPEGSYEHTGGAGKFELATISDAQMGIAPNSLIPPCEDVYVYLDLTEYPREELKEMKVDTILELLKEQNTVFTIQEGQKVILVSLGDIEDIYRVIEREDTLDLTEMQDAEFTMTLRVGTGNQLDYDAVQYIVTVTIAPETVTMIEDALTFELSRNRGEMGTTVFDKPNRVYMESHFSEDPAIPVTAVVFYVEDSVEGNYNVSISSTFRTQNNDISVNLYKMEDFLRLYREEEGTLDESEGLEWNVTISENPDPVGLEAVYCIAYFKNPHIITETLGDAVKGERYSCQIEHSKLPDWNEVTFHLVEGKLPQGLHLDPKTGEISGTPEETGDFRIEVGASYSIDEFDESYAEYTLKVGDSSDDDEEIDPGDDEEIDSGDDEGSDSGDDEEIGSGGDSGSGSDSGSESGSDSGGSGSESGSGSGSRDSGSIIDTAGSGYTDDSWVWDGNGWKCKAPDGSVLANGWHQLPYKGSTDWYFFDGQGYMVTGWLTHEGQTYYLNPEADGNQGKMCTGWMYLDDTWYYFNEESDGTKGAMLTSGWHYLSYNGRMDWYYFDEKGKMLTGWITTDDERYYLNPVPDGTRGKMCTGWLMVDGKWYYFNEAPDGTRGAMAVNTWVDGRYVDGTGARAD